MSRATTAWTLAGLAFAGALAIYLAGAAPGLLYADSGELQALGQLGGIAHPTGYPLFILVSRIFGRLAPGEPAFRITFMSAFWAAAALALFVAVLLRRGVRADAAFGGAMTLGAGFTFWTTSQRAEVYSFSLFLGLLALWRTIEALDSRRDRDRLIAGLLLGLTTAGHLSWALPVAVCGLALAWDAARSAGSAGTRLVRAGALLLCYLAGLTPYLYILWVQRTAHPFDYLRLVDDAAHPLGPLPTNFDTPVKRLWWLVSGFNQMPPIHRHLAGRFVEQNVSDTTCLLVLFEMGPIAFLGQIAGVLRGRARYRSEWGLLAVAWVSSVGFSVLVGGFSLLGVFLLPALVVSAWWTAWGFEALGAWLASRNRSPLEIAAALLVLPVATTVLAGTIRLHAYDHPIGPFRSRVEEEDIERVGTLIPSKHDFVAPRRFVEAALAAIPESSLVIGQWGELMPMKFARYVEKRRPDLTYLPLQVPTTFPALVHWQDAYGARRPIVFLNTPAVMAPYLRQADTLTLSEGSRMLLIRTPQPALRAASP